MMILRALTSVRRWLAFLALAPNSRGKKRLRLHLELLEDRLNPSAGLREQYMLELVNRMRGNPAAELPLLLNSSDADVNSALAYFHVDLPTLQSQWSTLTAAPPLAWNDNLAQSALTHDSAMLAAGTQSHQVAGEADLGTRISAAGYAGWSSLGENIYAYASSLFSAHAAFAIDWGSTPTGIQSPPGHRDNIMSTSFRDLGIGVLDAPSNPNVGPLLITQDFGNRFSYGNPNVLGVVFNDANGNGYYDQGEGLGNVTLTIVGPGGSSQIVTTAYGGYQTQLSPGTYTITGSGGTLFAPITQSVTVGTDNVHLDFVRGPQPSATIPFTDDFNRTDTSMLGGAWTPTLGSFSVASNVAFAGTAALNIAVLSGVALVNTAVQADLAVGVNQNVGLIARYQANGTYYLARIANLATGRTASIYKYVGGVYTLLNKTSLTPTTGTGTLRFEAVGSSLKLFFGPDASHLSLLAYAFDTTIGAAGTAGIRASKNASVDNFLADEIVPTAAASLPFTDAFTQPDGSQLARTWTERQGNFQIAGNALIANDPATSLATVNGLALADVALQADVVAGANQVVGLIARYQGNGNYYLAQFANLSTGRFASIYKFVAGVGYTLLNKGFVAPTAGTGTLRFEVVGSSLKLFFGPDASHLTLLAYAFDTAISGAGTAGVRASKNVELDNFLADAIETITPTSLPFTDSFASSPGNQLSRNWTERQGNFTANGAALGNDPSVSLATVNGEVLVDATVQADIIAGPSQAVGLIARYQSNGSYYLAQVSNLSTGRTAIIYKYVAGVGFTRLSTMTPALTSATGTLRFQVVGSSLMLYFGPDANHLALIASATDTTIAAPGLTGIRAGKNASFANFTIN
jgi:hypothetical protein